MYNVSGMWKIRGFSLIELLISIGLVAALSAGVVSLIGQGPKQSGRDSKRKGDLESVRSALELYRNDSTLGTYPPCSGGAASCVATVGNIVGIANYAGVGGISSDPSGAPRQYVYRPLDATLGSCNGTAADRCTSYTVCAGLEKDTTAVVGNPPCGSCGAGVTCSWRVVSP
jgi:prepilin-type N-terminal cleavage/methylation domain-containing protein